MPVFELLYAVCVLWLSLYGLNTLILTAIYLYYRRDVAPEPPSPAEWPIVTVQLPIYNELHTVERLLTTSKSIQATVRRDIATRRNK